MQTASSFLVVPLLALSLASFACSPPDASDRADEMHPPAAAPAASQATPASDAPPSLTSRSAEPASGAEISAPGATFNLPAEWRSEAPSSSMRLAQAAIPGDAGEGQLTVFYFGPGGGGGVEANLQRWLGQVEMAPGSQPLRDSFAVGDFRVTTVEVAGTLKASTMGVGPTEPQADSRMMAAVVEGVSGPWFFKATGPDSTLASQRQAFLSMLRSVRVGS